MEQKVQLKKPRRQAVPGSGPLKPQDVVVLLKVAGVQGGPAPVRALEKDLNLSKSAVAQSLTRLAGADLLFRDGRALTVNAPASLEFLAHAVRYLVPARVEGWGEGIATGPSSETLAQKLVGGETYVMPRRGGRARGRLVSPVHPCAPEAAALDPRLAEALGLVDALRMGRARDRALAKEELAKWLSGEAPSGS